MLTRLLLAVFLAVFVLTAWIPANAAGVIKGIKVVPKNVIIQGQGFAIYVTGQGVCDDLYLHLKTPVQQFEWKWYNAPPFNGKPAYDLGNPKKLFAGIMGNIGTYHIIARPGPHAKKCKGRAEARVVIKETSTSKPGTGAAPSKPDLVVESISLKQKPSGQCVPYISIKNVGGAGVPLTKYQTSMVYLTKPSSILGEYKLAAVDPGHKLANPGGKVGFEWKSVWLNKGAYAFGATADGNHKISELNEGNNTLPPKTLVCGRPSPKRLRTPEGR